MKMASRNIASMHLFLEMKSKFPYLPDDTLRSYVFLYAQDQAKCLNLLQQESENHFHLKQQFSEFRSIENKNNKLSDNAIENLESKSSIVNLNIPLEPNINVPLHNLKIQDSDVYKPNPTNSPAIRTNRNSKTLRLSTKSSKFDNFPKQESNSAPILDDSERPFVSMFTSVPESSHNVFRDIQRDPSYHNRMMFSTTKEHILEAPRSTDNFNQNYTNSNKADSSKRHAVKLSITPMLPYQQQQMNLHNNAVCATTSHSSRPGRHTTSVNFQLQPTCSDQFPLEISSVPTGLGRPSNYRDFGSHVQISVGAQGTTFTALRLQRPSTSQSPNIDSSNQVSSGDKLKDYSQTSSHKIDSKTEKFPNSSFKEIPRISLNNHGNGLAHNETASFNEQKFNRDSDSLLEHNNKRGLINPSSSSHSYQTTPDYIQAVKNHQRSQLKIVQEELDKAKSIYSNIKSEVNRMEMELRKQKEKNSSSSNVEVIKKLREDNRQLRLECNCLFLEYDMISKGQIPIGVTDEDFYSNIFTGPNDGLALYSRKGQKSAKKKIPIEIDQVSDEDDEKNSWKCKKCTFVNHPALEKCEMCEISKNSGSLFDDTQ